MTTFDHFVYGSNLSIMRLRERCPTALAISVGHVRGRRLRFHKIGKDGTGKADAFWTGDTADRVWGVIVRCLLVERPVLDRAESLGVGYHTKEVQVHTDGGVTTSFLYQALPDRIDANLLPASWYHHHVVTGAREHSLPLDYQRMIQNHDVQNHESSSLPPIRRNR